MKKVFILATAGLIIATASFADGGKNKKCAKGKSCCSKEKEDKTVKM